MKINSNTGKKGQDIYLGTYYISPSNGKTSKSDKNYDFFSEINDEISFFKKKGVVIVQGDLNARTGPEKDFIEPDKFHQQIDPNSIDHQ